MIYKIIKIPGDGLMLISHPKYGEQIWALARLTTKHKNDPCAMCGQSIGVGKAFRPVTNLANRYERICTRHYASAIESAGNDE